MNDHLKELLRKYRTNKDCRRVILLTRAYEKHLKKLIKALIATQLEAHYLNLIISEDRDIANRHGLPGYFERKTKLVIKNYNISYYAHCALTEFQSVYPELFTPDGFQIQSLPKAIDDRSKNGKSKVDLGRI